jgi:hypothetical protein
MLASIPPLPSSLALPRPVKRGRLPFNRESIAAIGEDENPHRAVFD